MSEDVSEDVWATPFASADDFASVDLKILGATLDRADDHGMERLLDDCTKQSEADGNLAAARAYRLLSIFCSFHMRIDERDVWGPRWQADNGRSFIPSDFIGEQTSILVGVLDTIGHPSLRARVADATWSNDRTKAQAASVAINAYCEMIDGRLSGRFVRAYSDLADSVLDAVDWMERTIQIGAMTSKRGVLPEVIAKTFAQLYEHVSNKGQYVPFVRLASLGADHGLLKWEDVAPTAEAIATKRAEGDYPMAVQAVWDLAARGYSRISDTDGKKRCQERSVEETLRMREQVGSSSAQAYWTRKAIGELRSARGNKDRIKELRTELRDLQDAALDEFGQFEIPMDLSEERSGTIKIFENLTLPDILFQYATLARPVTVETLRQQAIESRKTSVLGSLFGASYADHEGKTIAETPGGDLGGEADDDWIKAQSLQYLDLWRHQAVGGFIEPARQNVMMRFAIEERHFEPIVAVSPFVPPGHEHIFALGFARHWQGDHVSAAYLLNPQLENSLRHVLINASREPTKIKPDLLQEDISLLGMLTTLRKELTDVCGEDLVNEIDLLFHYKPGPSLRHDMAHGKVSAGACYQPSAIYACWLIYRLTCIPLLRNWKTQIAPAIEAAAFGTSGVPATSEDKEPQSADAG